MTLDLDHLSKLAEAADRDLWKPDAWQRKCAFYDALTNATVQELIRLARLGMEREAD